MSDNTKYRERWPHEPSWEIEAVVLIVISIISTRQFHLPVPKRDAMFNESMSDQRLPSPPASVEGEYYPGIDRILQHNAEMPLMSGQYAQDGGGIARSGQSTAYGSPDGNHWMVDRNANDQPQDSYQHQEVGLGIDYVSVNSDLLLIDPKTDNYLRVGTVVQLTRTIRIVHITPIQAPQ